MTSIQPRTRANAGAQAETLVPVVASVAAGVVEAGAVVAADADGVTELELADAAEVPTELVAVEANV
jgi:hypothetical protein